MGLKKTVNRSSKLFFHFSDCSRDIANLMIFMNYDEKRWK
ncbi:hypothetical protein [Klebsiella variicola]|nr:hypothetical protein [Klebsiella variicola]HBZ8004699.1 hypothetical protein [Klebsiella variicola subsp. variicola]ELN4041088.1 hypothetical protein [Klebsiella variicola]HCB0897907.1 hypothetical protein [Klebsiella variicola subsp. variicola]HCB0911924.1 hypothetical protein [Klebsiella variicola subsp. variicola]HCB4010650.1 hypothetical protein [Klebsiella variicola subsp. variicola]